MNLEVVTLNNKEYYVVDKLEINNIIYYLLVQETDNEDFMIRKKIVENNTEYLIGLDDEEEFNLVLNKYLSKGKSKSIKKFFPVGTIVNLRDYDLKVMIVGYLMKGKDGMVYDYCGCNYPLGLMKKNDYLYFDNRNISKIIKISKIDDEVKDVLIKVEMASK